MVICENDDCLVSSEQVGTTEILLAQVFKDHTYEIELGFENSLIQMPDQFRSCPHIEFELSMIPVSKAQQLINSQLTCTSQESFENDALLLEIFQNLTRVGQQEDASEGFVYLDTDKTFKYSVATASHDLDGGHLSTEVTSKIFTVHERMQFAAEIFYEPYLYDLELSLFAIDNERKAQESSKLIDWTLYRGAKSLFIELEPGQYELKITMKQALQFVYDDLPFKAPTCVEFQLQILYSDYIIPQHLMPHSLNYLGLLNPKERSVSNHMIYMCEDCIFNYEDYLFKAIEFYLNKDIEMLIQLTTDRGVISLNLEEIPKSTFDKQTYGFTFEDPIERGKLITNGIEIASGKGGESETVISQKLKGSRLYRLVMKLKDYNDGELLDGNEEVKYSLRIESKAPKDQKQQRSHNLPISIDEIKRMKLKTEGSKESEFLMGSRQILKWIAKENMTPFISKSDQIYQAPADKNGLIQTLKFEVTEEEALIYVQLWDYTDSPLTRLGLLVTIDDPQSTDADRIDWSIPSVASKHHSYIEPLSLTRGTYYLSLIVIDRLYVTTDSQFRFSIDMIYSSENVANTPSEYFLNSIELCEGFGKLPQSFNSLDMISELNGHGFSTMLNARITDVLLGPSIEFTVEKPSLATFFLQLPNKDMTAELAITKREGIKKLIASTESLNQHVETFLKVPGQLQHSNIIMVREFLLPGQTYFLKMRSLNSEFRQQAKIASTCEAAKIGISVVPIHHHAKSLLGTAKCQSVTTLSATLAFAKHMNGTLSYDESKQIFDSTYIKTQDQGEGPFLFYFSLNFDPMTYEGSVISLVLSKFDPETMLFTERAVFKAQQGQVQIVTKIEEGTYVLAIQTLSSTIEKFTTMTQSLKQQHDNKLLLVDPCFTSQYHYYITSIYEQDAMKLEMSFAEMLASIFTGGFSSMMDDQLKRREFDFMLNQELGDSLSDSCQLYDELPVSLPATEAGFDHTYQIQIGKQNYHNLEFVALEDSFLKVLVKTSNHKDNINIFLYSSNGQLLANSLPDFDYKVLETRLSGDKKASRLKFVFDTVSENEECPMLDLRIALKPVQQISSFKCESNIPIIPHSFYVAKYQLKDFDSFKIDTTYQLQDTVKFSTMNSKSMREQSIDVEIVMPSQKEIGINKTLYFDVEIGFDFVTADIEMQLFQQSLENNGKKTLTMIGESKLEMKDPSLSDSISEESNDQSISKRLRTEQLPNLSIESQQVFVLRFILTESMLDISRNLSQSNDPRCFPIDLSLRVSASKTKLEAEYYEANELNQENELLRINWMAQGVSFSQKDQLKYYDPRQKLMALLQFKQSMKEQYKQLKLMRFAYLIDESDFGKDSNNSKPAERFYPVATKLSQHDRSEISLTFPQNVFKHGHCYLLMIEHEMLQIRNLLDNPDLPNQGQSRVCMSSCLCNDKGMLICDESRRQCLCKKPFTGNQCTQCESGFVFNPQLQDCLPANKCKQDGGAIDCNGHGTCYYEQMKDPKASSSGEMLEQAQCECDAGFQDDGMDFCARCTDPLFKYPHCLAIRQWMVDSVDHDCDNLPTKMPTVLYKSDQSLPQKQQLFQTSDLHAFWYAVFKLDPKTHHHRSTEHQFLVSPGSSGSILRLFLDTQQSGVKVKFSILDPQRKVIHQQKEAADTTSQVFVKHLKHESDSTINQPFFLVLDYEIEDESTIEEQSCHKLEILFILQPMTMIQQHLKCSTEEIEQSLVPKQFNWVFGGNSEFSTQSFVVNSDMHYRSSSSYINSEDLYWDKMTFTIKIEEGHHNALSVITSYNFETLFLKMALRDKKDQRLIALSRYASLEEISETLELEIGSQNNLMSVLEASKLKKGTYELEVSIPKFLFLTNGQTREVKNCLSFDIMVEYVSTADSGSSQKYEVVAIYPTQINGLQTVNNIQSKLKLEVKFAQPIDLEDLIQSYNDVNKICVLQNKDNADDSIHPERVISNGEAIALHFNFMGLQNIKDNTCYRLKCSTKQTLGGNELIRDTVGISTNYCFQNGISIVCNPNALAKVSKNQCICTYPYKGTSCEDCENDHYLKTKDEFNHTLCTLDVSKCSNELCNGHGKCNQQGFFGEPVCQCEKKYSGKNCDRCADPQYEYPDCTTIVVGVENDEVFSDDSESSQTGSRRYRKGMNMKDILGKGGKVIKDQCPLVSYPKDLSRVEYTGSPGEVHFADVYTINHDKDNHILFTPQTEGSLKILIQQPQSEDLSLEDIEFDLEIALYDFEKDKIIAIGQNRYLNMQSSNFKVDGKLDYSLLQIHISAKHIGQDFMILFRALNFSDSHPDESFTACEKVYIELQFASISDVNNCDYNPEIASAFMTNSYSNSIIKVSKEKPYQLQSSVNEQGKQIRSFSVTKSTQQFFYYQDFYIQETAEDNELHISLLQRFEEMNMIDFVIEIIEFDIDFAEAERLKESTIFNNEPQCNNVCMFSGQKSYNEISQSVDLSAKTYLRVWFMQSLTDGTCANSQLFLDIKPKQIQQEYLGESTICQELDLPLTLNTNRYLGQSSLKQQQSFHYIERFRVDNLPANTHHDIQFTLSESTLIRFVALVHKHRFEFDIELFERQNNHKLVGSTVKGGREDSIFVQLAPGEYALRLLFQAVEAHLMKVPCQNIEIEMAFKTIDEVKAAKRSLPLSQSESISLQSIFEKSNSQSKEASTYTIQSAIQTYSLTNQIDMRKSYKSGYVEILRKKFTIVPTGNNRNSGLQIVVHSDFLMNDVNFILTNLGNSKKHPHTTRQENQVQLMLETLPPGDYELLIFAFHCFTNMEKDYLQTIDVQFLVDFKFLYNEQSSGSIQQFVLLDMDEKSFKIPSLLEDSQAVQCYKKYSPLPQILNLGLCNEFYSVSMIPSMNPGGIYEHIIDYKADKPILSIMISGRPNTQFMIYPKADLNESKLVDIYSDPMFESFTVNQGMDSILYATNLKIGKSYQIVFEFGSDRNEEEIFSESSNNLCDFFVLHFKARNDEEKKCLRQSQSTQNPQSITFFNDSEQEVDITLTEQTVTLPLVLAQNITEIYINADYSHLLYIPTVKILKHSLNQQSSTLTQQQHEELKPLEVDSVSIKGVTIYRLSISNSQDHHFTLLVSQISKPKNCINRVPLQIRALSSKENEMLQPQMLGMMKTFLSQEGGSNGINDDNSPSAKSLPFTLDTYKYIMSRDLKREPLYLLVSEYIEMASEKNIIKFTVPDTQTDALLRVYLESSSIMISLFNKTDGHSILVGEMWHMQSLSQILIPGNYEIQFEYATQQQAVKQQQPVKLTVLLVSKEYYTQKYLAATMDARKDCAQAVNLPLALTKSTTLKAFEDEQIYDNPLMRLGGKSLTYDFILDSFNFRVNETSRFLMQLGSHVMTSLATLRLSEMHDYGNAYMGTQSQGLSTIDIILGPGDYQLQIEQPQLLELDLKASDRITNWLRNENCVTSICGIFSFFGRITPLRELTVTSGHQLQKCAIKEVLPSRIYKSERETKQGMEYFINEDGMFTHFFSQLLIKKSLSQGQAFDRVELTTPSHGLLSVTLQYSNARNNLVVPKLMDAHSLAWGFMSMFENNDQMHGEHLPLSKTDKIAVADGKLNEESFVFEVHANREYYLLFYYQGEPSQQFCDYYNAQISFSSLERMTKELSCLSPDQIKYHNKQSSKQPLRSLMNDIPSLITSNDILKKGSQYTLQTFTEVKYPQDYFNSEDGLLMKTIELDFDREQALYDIDVMFKFDSPFFQIQLGLYDKIQDTTFEDVSVQMPVQPDREDPYSPTMIRLLRAKDFRANKKYFLTISDLLSKPILGFINEVSPNKSASYCLYSELTLSIQRRGPQIFMSNAQPEITSVFPAMKDNDKPVRIGGNQKEVFISVTFSTYPQFKNKEQNTVSLQLLEMDDNRMLYSLKPNKVTYNPIQPPKNSNQPVTVSFTFDISKQSLEALKRQDHMLMKFSIDQLSSITNQDGKSFTFGQALILPQFVFEVSESTLQKKLEEERIVTQADKLKESIKEEPKQNKVAPTLPAVKCNCIHGYCRQGESTCFKCDEGWTGLWCDQDIEHSKLKTHLESSSVDQPWSLQESLPRTIKLDTEINASLQVDHRIKEPIYRQDSQSCTIDDMPSSLSNWSLFTLIIVFVLGCLAYKSYIGRSQRDPSYQRRLRRQQRRHQQQNSSEILREEYSDEEATELIDLKRSHDENHDSNMTSNNMSSNDQLLQEDTTQNLINNITTELQLFDDHDAQLENSSTQGQHGSDPPIEGQQPHNDMHWSPSALQPQSEAIIAATTTEIEEVLQQMSEYQHDNYQDKDFEEDRQKFL